MIVRHALAGITSSALSGLSNILIQLFAASLLGIAEFANFSIAAATMLLCLGFTRALIGQVDLVRGQETDSQDAVAAAALVSTIFGVVGLVVLVLGYDFPVAQFVGVGLIGGAVLAFQDALRFRFFAMRRPEVCLWADLLILGVAIVGLVAVSLFGVTALLACVVWIGATVLGIGAMFWRLPRRPISLKRGGAWLASTREIGLPSLGEFVLQTGLPYVLNFLFLGFGGAAALSGYRLGQLIFSAVGNIASGLNAVLTPRVVERNSAVFARKVLLAESVCAALVMLAVLCALVFVPEELGVAVFGEIWVSLGVFVVVCAVHGAANALATPCFSLLRVLGRAAFSFWVRVGSSAVTVLGVVLILGLSDPVLLAWVIAIPAVAAWLVRFLTGLWLLRVPGPIGSH